MIRILVVEDSKTIQKALVAALESDPELKVISTAASGEDAVKLAAQLKPDLITMDVNLPGMDGFEATRAIMSSCPVPIVIVTGRMDPKDSATLFRVMEAGALMVLGKPAPAGTPEYRESVARLVHNLKLMSEIKVVRRSFPKPALTQPPPAIPLAPRGCHPVKVVAIGASTGGPPLLRQILAALPADFGAAVLIVQHMADGFTENFTHWLDQGSPLPVRLAAHGMPVNPGEVLVAPDGYHLEMGTGNRAVLSSEPPVNGLRPTVAALFHSVALHCGKQGVGVLLTGMGSDGAQGLKEIRDHGGITIAQDRQSSVVFGMPAEAIRLNAAQYILDPEGIVELLKSLVTGRGSDPSPEIG